MTTEEKFHAAVNVIRSLPKNGSYQPSNELMLRFYAYFKQATQGPCRGARPAFWDVVGRAKHDAWARLGDMPRQQAMDNYVSELHRIVETMSYNDNVANFLEAQNELDSVPLGDLELVAGDVIERVRSQPNSPFASRDASPTRLSPAPTQEAIGDSDHSDDEYIDTMDAIPNGFGPHYSRSKTKMSTLAVDISHEVQRTIQSLQTDLELLNKRVNSLEMLSTTPKPRISFQDFSPSLLAFFILWPFVAHSFLRYWANRK